MYAGSNEATVFAETMAPFRRKPGLREHIHAETDEDEPDNPDEPDWEAEEGVVPPDYFRQRALARAQISTEAVFIDVDHPATHRLLNSDFGELLASFDDIAHYDRGVVMTQDRRVTRPIARFLYERYAGEADGIRYESRVAPGLECWALWPTARRLVGPADLTPLSPEDPTLAEIAELVGVELPPLDEITPREWADRSA